MSDGKPAARVGDPIAHTEAKNDMIVGALVGLAVGVVLVAAVVATGGAALAVVAAVGGAAMATSAGGLGGKYIGEASMGPPCGNLVTGSPNVFVNGRPATMTLLATAACSQHSGAPPLASGSTTVLINGRLAGREGEITACSAVVIAQCSPNVLIGGPSGQDADVAVSPEVADWAVTGLEILGAAGLVMALPYAIATSSVAAAFGAGVRGFVGGALATKGARLLGEKLGMSESGIRKFEVAAGLLGGVAAGGARMPGATAEEGALAGAGARPKVSEPAIPGLANVDRPIYRVDGRPPATIFDEGFQPRGTSTNLENYVNTNEASTFVGTSKTPDIVDNPAFGQPGRHLYEIDGTGLKGVDVNQTYPTNPFASESEIAVPGGIPSGSIISAKPILPGGGLGETIPNPNYGGGR